MIEVEENLTDEKGTAEDVKTEDSVRGSKEGNAEAEGIAGKEDGNEKSEPSEEKCPEEENAQESGEPEADYVNEDADAGAEPEKNEANAETEESGPGKEEKAKPEKKERGIKWAKGGKAAKKESGEDKLKAQLAEANDKYVRLFAEFDNFRNRTEKEKTQRYDMGARDVVEKILPVIDNFERGFAAVEDADKEDAFVKGMDLVYKQFEKVLADIGVKPIEAVGNPFNPDLHNAVMHVDDPEAGENMVVEEFQKGYMYKDQVVRYSMVKVAN